MFHRRKRELLTPDGAILEFLGFKIRLHKKGRKVCRSMHMCDKAYRRSKANLTKQVGNIKFQRKTVEERPEKYDCLTQVMGIQIIIS